MSWGHILVLLLGLIGWWVYRTWTRHSESTTLEKVARELLAQQIEGPPVDVRRRRIELDLGRPEPSGVLRFTSAELRRKWRKP